MDEQSPPERYRIVDPYHDDGTPALQTYYVVRKTPSGAWIVPRWSYQRMVVPLEERSVRELRSDWGARFTLDGDGRRYAHETLAQARYAYKRRKQMQIRHARRAIARAENGLHWLETGNSTHDEIMKLHEMKLHEVPLLG